MIRRLNMYGIYARLACNLLPTLAFAAAWYVRFSGRYHFEITDYDPFSYFELLIFATLVWALAADHYRLANPETLLPDATGLRRVFAACGATYLVVLGGLFFYRGQSFSRIFLTLSGACLFFAALGARNLLRLLVRAERLAQKPTGLLIVGADLFAAHAAARLLSVGPPCRVRGYVRLPGQEIAVAGSPVYELNQLDELAIANGIDDIILALPPQRWSEFPTIMPVLERLSAPLRAVLDFGPGVAVREQLWRFGQLQLLDLGTTTFDSVSYVVLKRAMDIMVSLTGLLLMSPVMLAITVALRLTSRGPVWFVQDRVGFNGKVFRMYKFRTMETAPVSETDTAWSESALRCTRLGAFLRRHSLDELPQFFNVLKGDMSVVGPRPERPHFVRKFLQDFSRYNKRHRLKVGMTGWAQVNGLRGDTSISTRVEYDLFYLQNWSLGFDVRIIFMTLWTELFGSKRLADSDHSPESARVLQIQRGHSAVRRRASRM